MKLANYSYDQYEVTFLGSIFYAGAFIGSNMAFQSDSPSFVALLSYMTIVYAIMFDLFYFHAKLKPVEIAATSVILIVALGVAYHKLRAQIVNEDIRRERIVTGDLEIEKIPLTKSARSRHSYMSGFSSNSTAKDE